MSDLKCQCGKLLSERNVCPLPSGRICEGPNHLVLPMWADAFAFPAMLKFAEDDSWLDGPADLDFG